MKTNTNVKTIRNLCIAAAMAFAVFGPCFSMKAEAKLDVNARDYGAIPDDGIDDTQAINDAIEAVYEAGGGSVRVPAGTFHITASRSINEGILLKSNVKLLMNTGTILQVMPNDLDTYHVINVVCARNVDIVGGQIKGERDKHMGSEGEYGMGIRVRDSHKVLIQNMTIDDNWGDGIYLGTINDYDNLPGSSKIRIKNCRINNNRRNNITIADANNVTIEGCTLNRANGVAPESGIDIEPNVQNGGYIREDSVCKNIKIKNTKITCMSSGNTQGRYFALMIINNWFSIGKNKTVAKNVKIENCSFGGDVGNYSGENVSMKKTKVKGSFIYIRKTRLINCKIDKKEKWKG